MIIPDDLKETAIYLKDQFFDLRGLSAYSALAVGTLRHHIRAGGLPCFRVGGKLLVKQSEFEAWLESFRLNKKQNLDTLADDVLKSLKGVKSNK